MEPLSTPLPPFEAMPLEAEPLEVKDIYYPAVTYAVEDGSALTLQIVVDYPQVGATTLQLGPRVWTPDTGQLENPGEAIGQGADLRYHTLYGLTNVVDVDNDDNDVRVYYRMSGGPEGPLAFYHDAEAPQHRGQVRLHVPFVFI
jgi:hypothetical protein